MQLIFYKKKDTMHLGTPGKAPGGEEHAGLVMLFFIDNIPNQ